MRLGGSSLADRCIDTHQLAEVTTNPNVALRDSIRGAKPADKESNMATTVMQKSEGSDGWSGPQPGVPMAGPNLSAVNPVVGRSILDVRSEVDDAFADAKTFHNREPDEIMRMAGGHSARLSELRVKIMRIEDMDPKWRNVRAREIEPCLDELQRQYQIASRLHSVRELDWKMEAGTHS